MLWTQSEPLEEALGGERHRLEHRVAPERGLR